MMFRLTLPYTVGSFIVLVLLSEYPITNFQKPQLFVVVEAFINMGRKSRIGLRHRSIYSSDSVAFAFQNLDVESSQEDRTIVVGQPPYQIAGVDLSALWIDLVRHNKVSVSMRLPSTKIAAKDNGNKDDDGDDDDGWNGQNNPMVEYGIRMVEKYIENFDETRWIFEDYVQQLGPEGGELTPNSLISNINATLIRTQQQSVSNDQTTASGVEFKQVGDFVAQLQLVRTLRPPPSQEFLEVTTSNPPSYNPKTDSFVTGPLRLKLRPLVGRLRLSSTDNGCDDDDDDDDNNLLTTPWDVFHNISPADRRGHFLLLPSLLNKERNWRGQYFTKDDCHDLVHLTSTVEPAGSMFLGYNSVGAGASQNHIHCHSWPYPNVGSVNSDTTRKSSEDDSSDSVNYEYAVSNVDSIYDFYDVEDGKVEVSYLNYPVFCIQLSSSIANLDLLGRAVAACLEAIGEAPHNIGFLNRVYQIEEDEEDVENDQHVVDEDPHQEEIVDVFIFARSKERSSILPTLKLGISEMMGVFHAQNEAELNILATINTEIKKEDGSFERKCAMEQALADVSFENEEELWESIVANLATLENKNEA